MCELFASADGPETDVVAEGGDVVGDDAGLDRGWLRGEEAKGLVVRGVQGGGG